MMKTRYIVIAIICAISWSSAFAQTPTPTFVVPPTSTLVPPGEPGENGVWSICTLFQGASSYYCKYLNNGQFSVSSFAIATGSGSGMSQDSYHMLVAPSDVTSFDLYCVYGYAEGEQQNTVASGGTQSSGGSNINRTGTWNYSQSSGYSIYHAHKGTTTTQINAWGTYVINYPIQANDYQNGFSFRTNATANGFTSVLGVERTAYAEAIIQCQVLYFAIGGGLPQQWVDENPPTPTPSNTLTPTPTNIGAIIWPTSIPWSQNTPVPVNIGITPGVEECTVILPAFTFGPYTVFGYELGSSWSAITICNTEAVLDWEVMGIDFGAYTLIIVSIGLVGLIYSRMR